MTLLKNARFVCFDCEFTGLDPEQDQIIEIAAARFTFDETLETFDTLIKPDCAMTPEAEAIHGISLEMLADQPKIDEALPKFLKFIGNDFAIAHSLTLDLEMLKKAAEKIKHPFLLPAQRQIDTLRLARLYGDSPNNSLEQLAKHFNVPCDGAHRAMNDVAMTIGVFKHLVSRFKTVEQVMEVLARPIRMKYMPLGKHKGRKFSDIPLDYLRWAASCDFDQDLLYSIRLELKKRKQGNRFTQATNPFSEL